VIIDTAANHGQSPGSMPAGAMADGLRLTAYGPDGNDMQIAEDLPKAKPLLREDRGGRTKYRESGTENQGQSPITERCQGAS